MNYRHSFHAGNFADVVKHLILTRILVHLRDKDAPFRVIDTHAGAGLYDLADEEANRTGEWRDGIGRLAGATLPADAAPLVAPYLGALREANPGSELRFYPGSPLIAGGLLRPQDRLIACELEPQAAAALAVHLAAAVPARRQRAGRPDRRTKPQSKALPIDGWVALGAYVPPRERRGLVIIDPPYEQPGDFVRLADGAAAAYRKWPTGVYMLWYPIKNRDGPDRLIAALRRAGIDKALRVEVTVAAVPADGALCACGVIAINPPWKLAAEIEIILPALVNLLGRDGGRGYTLDRLDAGRAASGSTT
jgi:23S rRNA (adenine2030-N6)-methyltransferase